MILNNEKLTVSASLRRWAVLALCAIVAASSPAFAADEDESGPGLDDSYRVADLRPQYKACIRASGAVMPDMLACQHEEVAFQQGRLRAALARISNGPDGYFKDEVMNWQAEYMRHTDANCRDDDEELPVGESESCFMNRYANRADALEALADMSARINQKKP